MLSPGASESTGDVTSLANTTAVILAGGLGTRLRSVVPDRPKVLADVSGRPFIEYLLDQLVTESVQSVVLCTGYKGEQVQDRLGANYRNMPLHYSREQYPLGTGGALRLALPMIESDPVLVLNGDSYCEARLTQFAAWHTARESSATILLIETDDTRRYGRVQIDDESRIREFREKAATSGPGWINGGIYLLRRKLIETIPPDRAVSIESEIFPEWIDCGGFYGYRSEGRLWDIGVPDAYAEARTKFTSTIRK